MVAEAIATGQKISSVVMMENRNFDLNYPSEKIIEVSESVFKAISDEATPQGVLAIVNIPEKQAIGRLTRCIILDGLQDPGNVGAILRIAAACGVDHVFAISCADPYSPKAVRSSMSGIFRTEIVKTDAKAAVSLLKNEGIPIFVADMCGRNIFEAGKRDKFCLVLGNEGSGVSDYFRTVADETFAIPMENGIESLNVAVAAGVTLYALVKNLK